MHPIDKLILDAKLSPDDAVSQLSELTGLSDQELLKKMPTLRGCKGKVSLHDHSTSNFMRVQVSHMDSTRCYVITLDKRGVEIFPWENEGLRDSA